MQRDFFLATLISDRARPAIALPPIVSVRRAERISAREIRSGNIVGRGSDPCVDVCRELVRLGVPETHLQVFDGRVACFFMAIAETAAADPAAAQPGELS